MVRYVIKLIKVMHSDTDPRQIALGFSLGMIIDNRSHTTHESP